MLSENVQGNAVLPAAEQLPIGPLPLRSVQLTTEIQKNSIDSPIAHEKANKTLGPPSRSMPNRGRGPFFLLL